MNAPSFQPKGPIDSLEKHLTLTCCNKAYLPVLDAWLAYALASGIQGLLIISFDEETDKYCSSHRLTYRRASIPFPKTLEELFKYRLILCHEFMSSGHSVLLTDIDAVWLEDPMPRLRATREDIVASQGTIHPLDIFSLTGIVVCCGFIYFRESSRTREFLHECITTYPDHPGADDQTVVNRLLVQHGIRWQTPPRTEQRQTVVPGTKFFFTHYKNDIVGMTDQKLSVRLLDHASFQRILDTSQRPVISHLFVPKQSDHKLRAFELINKYPQALKTQLDG